MKHLIEWGLFESSKKEYSKENIESICEEYSIENWILNEDGSIDVDGDVDLYDKGLNKLPLKFRNVSGNFDCSFNELISLEDCPESVGGNFNCNNNKLISLKYGPESVSGNFDCSYNKLTSLVGSPESVGGNFWCDDNNLTSLEGSPKSVGGNFDCSYNKLTFLEGCLKSIPGSLDCSYNNIISLEGAPESIGRQLYCQNNPVEQIWNLFKDKDKIEFFNDLDIIRGNSIILDRLIYFLDVIGKPKTEEELRSLIKDYTFI
jgi:hypothetical protein